MITGKSLKLCVSSLRFALLCITSLFVMICSFTTPIHQHTDDSDRSGVAAGRLSKALSQVPSRTLFLVTLVIPVNIHTSPTEGF